MFLGLNATDSRSTGCNSFATMVRSMKVAFPYESWTIVSLV